MDRLVADGEIKNIEFVANYLLRQYRSRKEAYEVMSTTVNTCLQVLNHLTDSKDVYLGHPLVLSAQNGHLEVVKYLLLGEVDSQYLNDAFALSAGNGHLEVVKCLLEHGATMHYENHAAARLSVVNGHLEVVKYLVEQGASKDDAFIESVIHGRLEIAKYLLPFGSGESHFR